MFPIETLISIASRRQPSSLLPMTVPGVRLSTRVGTPTTTRKQILWLVRNTRGRRLKFDWQKAPPMVSERGPAKDQLPFSSCRPYKFLDLYFLSSNPVWLFNNLILFSQYLSVISTKLDLRNEGFWRSKNTIRPESDWHFENQINRQHSECALELNPGVRRQPPG